MRRETLAWYVAMQLGCGARSGLSVDAPQDANIDGSAIDTAVDAAPNLDESIAEDAIGDVAPGRCGETCVYIAIHSLLCRSRDELAASARWECTNDGVNPRTVHDLRISDPCDDGTGDLHLAQFACCGLGQEGYALTNSTPGCPPTRDAWAPGTPCANLWCNYRDACGNVVTSYCNGDAGWGPYSDCGCGK
jgi:hypothetical protein